ncbi:MAG: DUF6629 family protein [Candidatus Magasanikbacteria bacterium]|jgi:hypothetical protein
MCFSATASFTASAVLGVVGAATLGKTKNKRAWLLSAVPLLFALQQFTEGLLWVSLDRWPTYTLPLTHVFLFFALFVWPIYTPLMILLLEPSKIRRIIIGFFLAGGIVVGTMFYLNYLTSPEVARVLNRCLYYPTHIFQPESLKYLYIVVTVGSGLISSRMIAKLFCLLVLVGSVITWVFYTVNFTSVWCFFAATISVVLYLQPQKD